MDIKNKLTVTCREWGRVDNEGKNGKGQVKEHVKGTHGQRQWGQV